jgi:hypothetical protein
LFCGCKNAWFRVQTRLWVQKLVLHTNHETSGRISCARDTRRDEKIRLVSIPALSIGWLRRVVGGGGEKRSRLFIESPITLGLYSPSRHHHRRLRPPAYGSPNKTKTKTKQKKSSPGLSNRPCGLGPTAHLSISNTEAERIPVIYKTKPKPKRRDDPATRSSKSHEKQAEPQAESPGQTRYSTAAKQATERHPKHLTRSSILYPSVEASRLLLVHRRILRGGRTRLDNQVRWRRLRILAACDRQESRARPVRSFMWLLA